MYMKVLIMRVEQIIVRLVLILKYYKTIIKYDKYGRCCRCQGIIHFNNFDFSL